MPEFLTNKPRYVLINTELLVMVILILLVGVVAMRRLDDMQEKDLRVQAHALVEASRAALSLNFAEQLVKSGGYEPPFSGEAGAVMTAADRAALEAMLKRSPIYPPGGSYDTPAGVGFRWYLVEPGGARPAAVPVITAITDDNCDASDSLADPPRDNDDCDVRGF